MSEKIKALGFELVGESQREVTYKKEYNDFVHIVTIEIWNDINIFSMDDKFTGHPVGLNIEEMEAFLEKMKEMRGKE